MARGTWQGGGTWQTSGGGGGLVLAVIAAAVLIGSGAVSAAVHLLVAILIALGCVIGAAVLGALAWLVHRARSDRPVRRPAAPIWTARPDALPPRTREPLTDSPRPELAAPALHIHFHGLPDEERAHVIRQALNGRTEQ